MKQPARDSDLSAQAAKMELDLRNIRRAIGRPLETETAKGQLTVPQTAVMREVVRSEGISLRDLSRSVSLAHSTVSGIVDRLEERGMIERRADPHDGRISSIYPTAVVRHFVQERMPALNRGPLLDALARATPEERISIAAALQRLRELLENNNPPASMSGSDARCLSCTAKAHLKDWPW